MKRVHGYTSPFTQTRRSPIDGKGLFAKTDIKKREVVAAWGGRIRTKAEVARLPKTIGNLYALEVFPGFYLAETKLSELDASDFINHSCEPNCEIKNILVMVTKRNINKGEELTADFSSPSRTGVKTRCTCGARTCNGFVYF